MKILWFSPVPIKNDLTSGGWVISLAKSMLKIKGLELHVAFRSNLKNIEKKIVEGCHTWHIPSEEFSKNKILMNNYFGRALNRNIDIHFKKVISQINPDIIQVFGTESVLGEAILTTEIPSVIHIQCVYHIYHHKYFSGLSKEDVRKYSSFSSKLLRRSYLNKYKNKNTVLKREKLLYETCKNFLGRTDWDRRCCSILAPSANYYHCDEAMRQIFFEREWKKEFDNKVINIVTIIGGSLYKGLETIVETTNLLERNIDFKINWKVVGLSHTQDIVKLCKKKYKDSFKNIKILGKMSSEEIVDTMCNSDIYVHPSHIENSPNSVSEAMLIGMPVIATFTGGTPSVVSQDHSGLLIQDGDPWSMAGAILELYKDPARAKEFGRNARIKAYKRHDPNRIVTELLKIYQKIIQ